MIVDTSVVLAILFREEGYETVVRKLIASDDAGIGSPTLVEAGIVLSARLGRDGRALLARFLAEMNIAVYAFTDAHFGVAAGAWLTYGKGRHPASLNFGDCLAYAVAKIAEAPLLCVGEDFSKTDLLLA